MFCTIEEIIPEYQVDPSTIGRTILCVYFNTQHRVHKLMVPYTPEGPLALL